MIAAYYTFGCKLNFAETSALGRMLSDNGIRRAEDGEVPDICVVNTCSVTETADKKCRQLIHSLSRRYPNALIVATGCYAQLKPDVVGAMDGVSIVLGANDKFEIVGFIEQWLRLGTVQRKVTPFMEMKEFKPSCERGDRTRWFLKVQDGCDCFCSYCTIPYARGRSRSGSISDMVSQARYVAEQGGKEIVITGVNIGDFGKGRNDNFFDLIRALDEVEGVERYRISSIEPDLLTPKIIEWVGKESRAFMPHFHIPLQSGSDSVLKIMGRRYDTSLFKSRIEAINELIPDAFIGVDVIAGSRGEGEKEWRESYEFIKNLSISRLHVFPYSERPGTRALKIDSGPDMHIRRQRVGELNQLSKEKLAFFIEGQLGKIRPVLWESNRKNRLSGLTDNYLRIVATANSGMENSISEAKLMEVDGDAIIGEIIGKKG